MTGSTQNLNEISATEIIEGIASGAFSAEEVVDACLARIQQRDSLVRAWEFLDPEYARRQARLLDAAPGRGDLWGVPVGIKDIMDTVDMPTGMGSPIYQGHLPLRDAACVATLRAAGTVFPGKTVTCEFAGLTPGKTANPHDPTRTPGGSSSGSAAAVADFMVPVALGTQTGGSVLRPSSYCGIIGFKPSRGIISLEGVFPAAPSLDTLGFHARNLDDIERLLFVLAPRAAAEPEPRVTPPVIGLCRTWTWAEAQPETREAVEDAAARLDAEGARIVELELSDRFHRLSEARALINDRERAKTLDKEWTQHCPLISPRMRATITSGRRVSEADYTEALNLMNTCRSELADVYETVEVILTPAVDGEAPSGLADTGDPRFQSLWTMLETPAVSLPTHRGPSGLPVGIQLVAPFYEDARLIGVSRWVMERLA